MQSPAEGLGAISTGRRRGRGPRRRRAPACRAGGDAANPAGRLGQHGGAAVPSLASPRVSERRPGRVRTSVRAWISVVWPPRDGPMPWASARLSRHGPRGAPRRSCCRWPPHPRPSRLGQDPERGCPEAMSGSAVVDRGALAIRRRTAAPAAARHEHVQDAGVTRRSPSLFGPGWFLSMNGSITAHQRPRAGTGPSSPCHRNIRVEGEFDGR